MRTKEEIAEILARRGINAMLEASVWADLVGAMQLYTVDERDAFVQLIINNRAQKAGLQLYTTLKSDAEARSRANVDLMLADDNLSLVEIDALI